jgi:hypothetical protein
VKPRFFPVPMLDGDEESQELNRFLSTNRVLQVERYFVSDGSRSAWAICMSYVDRGGRPPSEHGKWYGWSLSREQNCERHGSGSGRPGSFWLSFQQRG